MRRTTQYKVVHTFTRAPSPAQICSYTVIALQSVIFYVMIRPKILSQTTSLILTILFSASLLLLLITTLICSYIDPSDPVMVKYKTGKRQQIQTNLQQLLFCQYCQSSVTVNAKHCRQCDRCVQNFDHHCMWINNCVGSRNYKPFIVMITSTCVNLGLYLASVVYLTVEKQWDSFLGFMVTCWVVMVVVFVLWFLLVNLNVLHFYLMCKGYTTYQFIVIRKEEERLQQLEQARKARQQRQRKLKQTIQKSKKKINQIVPTQGQKQTQVMPKTPKKQQQKQKSQQNERDTHARIKMDKRNSKQQTTEYLQNRKQQDNKFLQTTDAKIKPTDQNTDNVFNAFYGRNSSQNSEVASVKLDNHSIKEQVILDDINVNNRDNHNQKVNSDQDTQSIRISQFFIRNKSFNYILSNQQVDKPHKKSANLSLVVDDRTKNRAKANDSSELPKIRQKATSQQNLLKNNSKKKAKK